jgi:sterol desaturase/sphingolipid hydroxylase (fatty acid hydroxylase superfamily)
MRAALGPAWFAPAFAGLLAGYLWYDLTHYAVHHLKPRTALGEAQRRYHYLHHFKTPDRRYGVTTPVWDLVFGTRPGDEGAAEAEG